MKIEQVKITAEQFANKIKKRRLMYPDITDRDEQIDNEIRENFRGLERQMLFNKLTINTISKKCDEQDHRATRDTATWVQASLFDEPGFRLPATMEIDGKKKSWLMVTLGQSYRYLTRLSEQVHKEGDQLLDAAIAMKSKASEIDESIVAIETAMQTAKDRGYNPEDLTYEEATSPAYAE